MWPLATQAEGENPSKEACRTFATAPYPQYMVSWFHYHFTLCPKLHYPTCDGNSFYQDGHFISWGDPGRVCPIPIHSPTFSRPCLSLPWHDLSTHVRQHNSYLDFGKHFSNYQISRSTFPQLTTLLWMGRLKRVTSSSSSTWGATAPTAKTTSHHYCHLQNFLTMCCSHLLQWHYFKPCRAHTLKCCQTTLHWTPLFQAWLTSYSSNLQPKTFWNSNLTRLTKRKQMHSLGCVKDTIDGICFL